LSLFRVGRFLPEGGKNGFSMVKTGLAKIPFAGKNKVYARIVIKVNLSLEVFYFLTPSGS